LRRFSCRFHSKEMDMRKLTLTFLAGAGALIASSAYAADEIPLGDTSPLLHQVGVVCQGDGQCWLARDGRRASIRDKYYVSPRYDDDYGRGYYWRPGDGPGFRFGIGPD
jgi:hypothetical protein